MRQLDYEYDYAVPAYFAVSKYCNIRCSYCYLPEDFKNRKEDIDFQALQSISLFVQKAQQERFALDRVYLHGAEPTTLQAETIREAVRMLQTITLRPMVNVQTNGVAVNRKYLDRLGDMSKELAFGYSVDLPPAAHNKNRQGTYDKIIENIKEARDRGYEHRLLVCVNQDTMKDLPAVKREIDFYHKEFPAMTIAFKTIKGDQQITDAQKIEWADFLSDEGLYDYDHSIWGRSMICQAQGNDCWWFEFAHDGNVTACNKTYNGDENFANWLEEPMMNIVQKRRVLYQNYQVPKECFGCKYWPICKGGCPVDRYVEHKTVTEPTGVQVTGNRTITLDCAIKKRIYTRMEAGGIEPLVEEARLPYFTRQKTYNRWVKTAKDFGFTGEQL